MHQILNRQLWELQCQEFSSTDSDSEDALNYSFKGASLSQLECAPCQRVGEESLESACNFLAKLLGRELDFPGNPLSKTVHREFFPFAKATQDQDEQRL
ncbi:MAG: hypothetical protein K7J46_09790 [Bryobacter sp.]|jgi:hypothetical protein|nr:hypothetical protein [Bryobacter sp. CoA8 C33]